ncbi:MAG: 50S ribosomal protein L25 [Candidatus Omnitrophica bacterium]|nr:50S ribosomal protein L25 [Candidatus Omnitrophota bacterium]
MEEIKLDVQIRSQIGKEGSQKVRKEDCIPAIVYGEHKDPTAIKVDRRSFERIRREHRGESVVFHLNVLDGEKKLRDYAALVKEVQHHPVSDSLLHIDFIRISLTEKIEVKIPIHVQGDAVGVKKNGGSVDHHLREIDVICLPTKIPSHIDVDVSDLDIHDALHVKDLVFPEGVVTEHDLESIVVSIAPPMREIEEEPSEEDATTEPEVIKEKKKEAASEKADSEKEEKLEG